MSTRLLENYLRAHRRRAGLQQRDVAFLLGHRAGTNVSRNERFVSEPCFRAAIAYSLILRVSLRELFKGTFDSVSEEIRPRISLLVASVEQGADQKSEDMRVAALRLAEEGLTKNEQ